MTTKIEQIEANGLGADRGDHTFRLSLNGSLFARNAVFNLTGELATLCVGIISVPYVVKTLGTDAFGILSIAWVLLGYMSLFDLGLSRATTKFVAEAASTGEHHKVRSIIWTSIGFQLAFGLLGGSVLVGASHVLAEKVFKIPVPLLVEARNCFVFLAIAVPMILVTNSLRGVLEAVQHFDWINYVKIPTNLLMFASPLILIPFGARLASIILLMTVWRFTAMLGYLWLCFVALPAGQMRPAMEKQVARRLLGYGSWITISNVAGPLLMYADRFAIGTILSVAALAYYTGPADMVNRTLVIPASLASSLFPAFSSLEALGAKEKLQDLCARSLKYMLPVLGPALLLIEVFSYDILHLWLGPAFAARSSVPLQILALAVFVNALGMFPFSLLHGAGRPDVTALFHVVELPLHLGLVYLLVLRFGITGAAVAVVIRVSIDTGLILWACRRFGLASPRVFHEAGVTRGLFLLLTLGALMLNPLTARSLLPHRLALTAVLLLLYSAVQWYWGFDSRDRQFLSSITRQFAQTVRNIQHSGPEQYILVHSTRASGSE